MYQPQHIIFLIIGEQNIFRDILQDDFMDSYNNLTLKSIFTLKFFSDLGNQNLLLFKTDDDSFVHIGKWKLDRFTENYNFPVLWKWYNFWMSDEL